MALPNRSTYEVTDFIALAEDRLNNELRVRAMLVTESETVTNEVDINSDLTTPVEKNPIYSIEGLRYVTPEEYDNIWTHQDAASHKVYTVKGDKVLLAPVPASGVARDVTYYQKVTALSDGNTTNIFTANASSLLFYAALLEATPFLKDDERIPVWQGMYERTLSTLNGTEPTGN